MRWFVNPTVQRHIDTGQASASTSRSNGQILRIQHRSRRHGPRAAARNGATALLRPASGASHPATRNGCDGPRAAEPCRCCCSPTSISGCGGGNGHWKGHSRDANRSGIPETIYEKQSWALKCAGTRTMWCH